MVLMFVFLLIFIKEREIDGFKILIIHFPPDLLLSYLLLLKFMLVCLGFVFKTLNAYWFVCRSGLKGRGTSRNQRTTSDIILRNASHLCDSHS